MEGATDSGEGVLGMERDCDMFWQKRSYWREICISSGGIRTWGEGMSVEVSPWKIFYIFSFANSVPSLTFKCTGKQPLLTPKMNLQA